jgi:hypothetical protein
MRWPAIGRAIPQGKTGSVFARDGPLLPASFLKDFRRRNEYPECCPPVPPDGVWRRFRCEAVT